MFSKNRYSLLIHYIFVYPMYYVVAMLVATLVIAAFKGWSFEGAKGFFLVMAISMWIASYLIHYKILFYAISDLRNDKSKK